MAVKLLSDLNYQNKQLEDEIEDQVFAMKQNNMGNSRMMEERLKKVIYLKIKTSVNNIVDILK